MCYLYIYLYRTLIDENRSGLFRGQWSEPSCFLLAEIVIYTVSVLFAHDEINVIVTVFEIDDV